MDYSIKPGEHELREIQQRIENAVQSYEHAVDIDSVRFNLAWQDLDEGFSVITEEGSLTVIIGTESGEDELNRKVLRGLLELEFLQEAGFDEINFNWQEVLKLAYVKIRVGDILDEERQIHEELEARWPELKKELGKRSGDFGESFYMNAAILGESIGQKLLEDRNIDELPGLTQSEVKKAGDELFG